jgi:hypothetical protein
MTEKTPIQRVIIDRVRPAALILSRLSGVHNKSLIAAAKSRAYTSGRYGSGCAPPTDSKGIRMPVSPSSTTSGIPPTAEATTGVPQAIASKLMIPKRS